MTGRVTRRRTSDMVLAIFLIAITLMLLVPLPTLILDFLLVINITFAIVLLLAGLYMPNTLAMLSFPSILLLTTLFRLSLNVASTRLILSQGDAGRVIQAFGSLLISGEVVVGIIIFLIITVVNFIVVARGSTRVSEVAARFALDALPGKQMAIDSDLRAGLITSEQAQARRDDLRMESQLYGSMDGAMKFVQGDAIAGLFIIATNILGGMYLGIRNGMGLSEAVQTYTTLTVGDGLVNQIPAILISICAGLVVTRVSSGAESSLGADVQAQVFTRPGTLMFAGGMMVFAGTLPALPMLPFVVVGLVFVGTGFYQRRSLARKPLAIGGTHLPYLPNSLPQGFPEKAGTGDARIMLDPVLLFRFYQEGHAFFEQWWLGLQSDYFDTYGVRIPIPGVTPEPMLPGGGYVLWVNGAEIERGRVLADGVVVESNPINASLAGLTVLEETTHPLHGARVFWSEDTVATRRICQAADIQVYDAFQFISLRLLSFFKRSPEEIVSLADVLELEQQLEKKHPGLVTQALNRDFINSPRLNEVLQELLRDGMSVKDLKQIVELLSTYCATRGSGLVAEGEFDLEDITAYLRVARRRHLVSAVVSERRSVRIISLSHEVEEIFEEIQNEAGMGPPALAPAVFEGLEKGLRRVSEQVFQRGLVPVCVLCRADLRTRVSKFVRYLRLPVTLLTFEELEAGVSVEPVGVWQA